MGAAMSYSESRYERVAVPEEPPERRIHSFDEVLHSYSKEVAGHLCGGQIL
ncbi:MAG: hypothetical protein ACREEC_05580 [Thermoplasmata archaeon]